MDIYEKNIRDFNKQLSLQAVKGLNFERLTKKKPDSVTVVGMGGSGFIGTLLEATREEINLEVPVFIVKDNTLPHIPSENPLLVFISFSGNTEETIDCFESALKRFGRERTAVVTGGGFLLDEASKKGVPLVTFDRGFLTPRQSSGLMYYGLGKVLKRLLKLRLGEYETKINPAALREEGFTIARKLRGKNALIYSGNTMSHLSYIWKTNLNETSKNGAFSNVYPEVNHNEIVGFDNLYGPWTLLFLGDYPRGFEKKIGFLARKLKRKNIQMINVKMKGGNFMEKTWNGIILSHWVSFSLALLNGVEPSRVKIIEELKSI